MAKINLFSIPLNISKYVHSKVYILLIIIVFFSFLYLILDDSHFSGLNTIQEMIREEVLKRKIENKVTKNVDTHIKDAPIKHTNTILNHIIETPKIFEGPFKVAVTCVRVPVLRAHCESINLEFNTKVTLEEVYDVLEKAPGIRIVDDRVNNKHPEPLDASGEFDILVGRIRYDQSLEEGYGIEMFIAGDQLMKGAALNAVQIAELLLEK